MDEKSTLFGRALIYVISIGKNIVVILMYLRLDFHGRQCDAFLIYCYDAILRHRKLTQLQRDYFDVSKITADWTSLFDLILFCCIFSK